MGRLLCLYMKSPRNGGNMKNVIKVVWVLIGTIIGAGFASGQEIDLFFYSYGLNGLFGIILMSALTGIMIYKVLKILMQNDIKNYKEFLSYILGKQKNFLNSKKILYIQNAIVNIFLYVSFLIMVAGFASFLKQEYKINQFFGSIIIVFLFFIICIKKKNGLIKLNEILMPLLIGGIFFLGIINLKNIDNSVLNMLIQKNNSMWSIGAVVYFSYNFIILIPILISLIGYVKKKKEIRMVSIITGLVIAVIAIIIYFLLSNIDIDITYLDIPIMYSIKNINKTFAHIYSIIIVFAIITSCVSAGHSFLENICKNEKSYQQIVLFMCITGVLISHYGFSNLVNLLYPTFGIIGILQIILLMRA